MWGRNPPSGIFNVMITIDIPYIHCYVRGEFVSEQTEPIECYIFAATAILNRPLLFTCHTISGAVYSRLPVEAFISRKDAGKLDNLAPWGCIGNYMSVVEHQYLKDYEVTVPNLNTSGRYLMTFDQFNGGFSEDPEQHKTMNFIELETGQYALMPNNYCIFNDSHFTRDDDIKYKRQISYWRSE